MSEWGKRGSRLAYLMPWTGVVILTAIFLNAGRWCAAQSESGEKIAALERMLRDNPNLPHEEWWSAHNELRHLYGGINERKAMEHCDAILQREPVDGYILSTLGAEEHNTAVARSRLLSYARKYGDLAALAASCRLKAAELTTSPSERQALLKQVLNSKTSGLDKHRELARLRLMRPDAILNTLKKEGKLGLAEELEADFQAALNDVVRARGTTPGHIVMGIVQVEDGLDPRYVSFGNGDILESGYFVTSVAQGKPLVFSALGYESVRISPKNALDTFENIGVIRLPKVKPSAETVIQGRVSLEGRSALEGTWVEILPDPTAADRITTVSGSRVSSRFERSLGAGWNEKLIKVSPTGSFSVPGLAAGSYEVLIKAEGYVWKRVIATTSAGRTTSLDPIVLELPREITLTWSGTGKPPFPAPQSVPSKASAVRRWSVDSALLDASNNQTMSNAAHFELCFQQAGTNVTMTGSLDMNRERKMRYADLGPSPIEKHLNLDVDRVDWRAVDANQSQAITHDHTYLLEGGWPERGLYAYALVHMAIGNPIDAPALRKSDPNRSHLEEVIALPDLDDLVSPDTGRTIPLTSFEKKVISALQLRYPMPFDNECPLSDVLKFFSEATRVQSTSLIYGLQIYVDPQGLRDVGKTMQTAVRYTAEDQPLATSLSAILRQLGLTAYVRGDGLVIVSTPARVERFRSMPDQLHEYIYGRSTAHAGIGSEDRRPEPPIFQNLRMSALSGQLTWTIRMPFEQPTPLSEVLRYVETATVRPDVPKGLRVVIDPQALRKNPALMATPITCQLSTVPLSTSLQLIADQINMVPTARDDGTVVLRPSGGNPTTPPGASTFPRRR